MDTLFSEVDGETRFAAAPLAVRMRPRTLSEVVGQEEAIGKDTWLRRAIANDTLSSVILFGPAGTGKTSIAHVIANSTNAAFVEVSAVSGTVADLRREIKAAEERLLAYKRRTILFIDEIHRFSRSQQDALLHAVEDRIVILIGATTENPFFEVNSALISRSRIVELKPIGNHGIKMLVKRAIEDERGLASEYTISDEALNAIVITAGGDARTALTTLELAAALTEPGGEIGTEQVREASPRRQLPYDKDGDTHYDVISAFIKSMRGSDPDATVYWLARMIEAGRTRASSRVASSSWRARTWALQTRAPSPSRRLRSSRPRASDTPSVASTWPRRPLHGARAQIERHVPRHRRRAQGGARRAITQCAPAST